MKHLTFILILVTSFVFGQDTPSKIDLLLNNWHEAAAKADFQNYFNLMDEQSVYIGTDATERWEKQEFMTYAKPYFDKGKAWTFKPLKRNITLSKDKKTAWFDELLDTQMKICRGSGVLVYKNGQWKIIQYVLSMTVPNEVTSKLIPLKSELENDVIKNMKP